MARPSTSAKEECRSPRMPHSDLATGYDVHFHLPGDESRFALESTICWAKDHRLGLQFLSSPEIPRLQAWLSRRLEEAMPQSVMDKFSTLPQD